MDKRKIGAFIAATVVATSMVSFANDNTQSSTKRKQITQEQQIAKTEKNAKWNSLTSAQKNEVYEIQAEIVALQKKQIDKMLSLGVIDQTTADAKKKALDENLNELKSSAKMPKIRAGRSDSKRNANRTKTANGQAG